MSLGDVIALGIYILIGSGIARVFSTQAKRIDRLTDALWSERRNAMRLEERIAVLEKGADRDAK